MTVAPLKTWFKRLALALAIALLVGAALVLVFAWRNPRLAAAIAYWREPTELVVPVAGVRVRDLRSTWGAPRSGGRKHRGVDIFAPRGTPVVSATAGVVWRVATNTLGGRVVWVVGEGPAAYYYAHLDDWAPGLRVGERVRAGDVLGFVGTTGNARTTPPHLHFAVHRLNLVGSAGIDPVPALAGARTLARPKQPAGKARPFEEFHHPHGVRPPASARSARRAAARPTGLTPRSTWLQVGEKREHLPCLSTSTSVRSTAGSRSSSGSPKTRSRSASSRRAASPFASSSPTPRSP